jgi:hypothetical protein
MTADELFVPPGHFYSPVFLPTDSYKSNAAPNSTEIEMNDSMQIELLNEIVSVGETFPIEATSSDLFYSKNDQYGDGDAFCYSAIIKHLQPSHVIEIGSGFSTGVLLDTLRRGNLAAKVTAIDPFPQRLEELLHKKYSLVPANVSLSIIPRPVQEVETSIYSTLKKNDILFIDSSHVSKTGSDVNFELFDIFPLLNTGVWVHIHDIFWPFEYPTEWIRQGRSWNENYVVRAYLTGNRNIKIKFFQQYLFSEKSKEWQSIASKGIVNPGGGLWLEIQ